MDNETRINVQGSTDGFIDRRAFIERGNDRNRMNKEIDVQPSTEENKTISLYNFNVSQKASNQPFGMVATNHNFGVVRNKSLNGQPNFDPSRQNAMNKFGGRLK